MGEYKRGFRRGFFVGILWGTTLTFLGVVYIVPALAEEEGVLKFVDAPDIAAEMREDEMDTIYIYPDAGIKMIKIAPIRHIPGLEGRIGKLEETVRLLTEQLRPLEKEHRRRMKERESLDKCGMYHDWSEEHGCTPWQFGLDDY